MTASLVADRVALDRLIDRVRGAEWIAFDTEFTRERTYYARLGLLQIASDDLVACVDPLAVNIEPLLDVLYEPGILKIAHAARQDLEVLYDLRGSLPRPLFDTQIAAALAGRSDQIGYGALVEELTGVKLPKLHTRTDWEARPLAPAQLRYAEDDVRYLGALYQQLDGALRDLGRSAWLEEECGALTDPALYRNAPDQAYRRLKQGHLLAPKAQPVLRELAAWRELTAQRRDLPRAWVVSDAALLQVARVLPTEISALNTIDIVSAGARRQWGAEIVAAVQAGLHAPATELWRAQRPLSPAEQALAERLAQRVRALAQVQKLSATLIASRRAINELVREASGPLVSGWRYQLVGAEFERLQQEQHGEKLRPLPGQQ